jgi:hypothetical protein
MREMGIHCLVTALAAICKNWDSIIVLKESIDEADRCEMILLYDICE